MATVDELIVRIEANTAQLRREMKRADRSVAQTTKSMGRSLKKSDAAFARLAKSALRFGSVLGAVGLARGVIGITITFAKALADLSAITGAVGKDLDFLKEKAREFGRTTTKSATDSLTAMKLIASAKPELLQNAEALAAITKEAITLSEAAQIDLPTATSALATALNQFSAPAEEAGRFINVLAAGSKLASAEIPALVQAMEIAGPAFAQANIPFEDFIALVGRFAASGQPIEQFATQFRNIILKLGTTADSTNPAIVGLFEALRNLEKEGLSAAESLRRFEIRGAPVIKQMFKITDSTEQLSAAITGTNVAYEQAKIQTDGLAGATDRLGNAWEDLNLSIGEGNGLIDQFLGLLADSTFGLGRLADMARAPGGFSFNAAMTLFKATGLEIPTQPATPGRLPPIKEIPISAPPGAGSVTPFLSVTPRPAGDARDAEFERLQQVRADTKKLMQQIDQDFLRATGRTAEAIVAMFKVRKDEAEKLLRAAGELSEEEIQRILSQLDTIRDQTVEGLKDATTAADQFGDALNFALQNAILNGQRLDKVLIRALKSAILFGADGKSGLLGGILGSLTGSLGAAFTIPGFAHGGDPQVGVPAIVGESGPEIFIPKVPGTIISNADSRRMGGGPFVFAPVNNFSAGVSNEDMARLRNLSAIQNAQDFQAFRNEMQGIRS